jgi:hypothetical protein
MIAAALLGGLLAACDEVASDTAGDSARADAPIPDIMANQREACEASGGRWGRKPNGIVFTCIRALSDANTQCSRETDCEGFCLARSRTCSPFEPLYGCHQVLSPSGFPQTVCVE